MELRQKEEELRGCEAATSLLLYGRADPASDPRMRLLNSAGREHEIARGRGAR